MKTTEYSIEIYEPESGDNCWVAFSSSSPFMGISVGDIVNPVTWEGSQSPMKVLRVINVEHMIWETDTKVKHKVMVYTEEVEGTEELRLTRNV